jgi:hypothetical protein
LYAPSALRAAQGRLTSHNHGSPAAGVLRAAGRRALHNAYDNGVMV